MKKIGETYDTDEFGPVIVKDIYISISSQFRVYEVQPISEPASTYFLEGGSLIEYNPNL